MKYNPFWIWTFLALYFVVFEAVGVWHEVINRAGDSWTLTHYLAHIPMGIKVGLVAWLAYHFLWQHPLG